MSIKVMSVEQANRLYPRPTRKPQAKKKPAKA
jgi:hypothetical protein